MKKIIFGLIGILVIGGLSFVLWDKKRDELSSADTHESLEITVDWKTYQNVIAGIEFKYPKNWILDEGDESSTSIDIHLQNIPFLDTLGSWECQDGFIGIEIQSLDKDSQLSFESFIRGQIPESIGGLGPSGKIEKLTVEGKIIFKVASSGWDSACRGPGYFIEENDSRYLYVFSGYDNEIEGENIILQILSTIKLST